MLAYLFPRDAEFFRNITVEVSNSRLWGGVHFRSDLDSGLATGKQVAALIIERAKNNGSQ
jgi:hypothetical protein